jgi:hypothetical protein
MEIVEVSAKEYAQVISYPYQIFNSADFNDLNKSKCNEVFYLLFRENKIRLGIIGGSIDNCFYSPFSAPFGGFSYISDSIKLQYIKEAVKALKDWAKEKRIHSIKIKFPPPIYETCFISKQLYCLWDEDFKLSEFDLNHSFNLDNFVGNYMENIRSEARRNLKIAINLGLEFSKCNSEREKRLAYEIIQKNRQSHGYPLKLTWEEVYETSKIIKEDFFLVYKKEQIPVAAAIVYDISDKIVKVIYWGNITESEDVKSMNFISYKIFEYYKSLGKTYVDIGLSTEHSDPNYGLIDFKESIGCRITPVYTLKASIL